MTKEEIIKEFRDACANLDDLITKAWELGGYCSGEEDFESLSSIQDGRKQIARLEEKIKQLQDPEIIIK